MLADFDGGRVIVAVTSTPFKCPPAPSETALLLHDYLTERGLRDSQPDLAGDADGGADPAVAGRVRARCSTAFAERGIEWHPERLVRELDPTRKVAILSDGAEMPFDLFLGVPVHRAPQVVLDSGLTVDGWIPVDPLTLETSFDGVYAIGDVTSVGTPKAGVFAEGQAAVAAAGISARIRGRGELGHLRRPRHLLPRVRPRPGRPRRRHLLERRAAGRRDGRAVGRDRGRQDRLRRQPDQPLVQSIASERQ